MGALSTMVAVARLVRGAFARRVYGVIYRDLDIWQQSRQLRSWRTGIVEEIEASPLPSELFAFFVYYEPQETVSASVRRVIEAMRGRQVNIVLICNHALSDTQLAYFRACCHTILLRDNQGYDFGGYKDAFAYARDRKLAIKRLLLLNDSLFFSEKGLGAFLDRMLGPEDVIGAFENWGEDHHIASYALSVSSHVIAAPPFQAFWRGYLPISNRIHAIENGEKKLSHAALAAARSSRIVYPTTNLYRALLRTRTDLSGTPLTIAQPWRGRIERLHCTDCAPGKVAREIADIINATSPIHAGAYYFPLYLDCPLFKKDIVYRGRFEFWEVESWIHEILDASEAEEYLTILRRKGDSSRLSRADRHRFYVGVK